MHLNTYVAPIPLFHCRVLIIFLTIYYRLYSSEVHVHNSDALWPPSIKSVETQSQTLNLTITAHGKRPRVTERTRQREHLLPTWFPSQNFSCVPCNLDQKKGLETFTTNTGASLHTVESKWRCQLRGCKYLQVQLENMETSYKCFVSAVSVNVRYLLNPKTLANHDVSLFVW